jgi:hypothetical protein
MLKKNVFRITTILILTSILLLPLASPVQAAEIVTGDPHAVIEADEVIDDDLFISGEVVQIDGTVNGDVFATGQEVIVNGTIEGNLFMAGQTLMVNGVVNGSVYSAGYSLVLGPNAAISNNAYSAGFSLHLADGGTLQRSLYSAGYQAVVNGEVVRDVTFSGAAFQLNGDIGRDLHVVISEAHDESGDPVVYMPNDVEIIEPGYVKSPDATVGGEIDYELNTYVAPNAPDVDEDAMWSAALANWVRSRVGDFMALLIVGAVLIAAWPQQIKRAQQQVREKPLQSLGWGLLLVVLFPIVLLIAFFLVILATVLLGLVTLGQLVGTMLSLSGLLIFASAVLFSFMLFFVSKIVLTTLVGETLLDRISPATLDGRWGKWIALLSGVVLYEVLRSVPILGGVVAFFVILLGLGGIALALQAKPKVKAVAPRKTRKAKA